MAKLSVGKRPSGPTPSAKKTPGTREEAVRVVATFVEHYNHKRLHSAIDYVTPADRLAGRHKGIDEARDLKLNAARQQRAACRQAARRPNPNDPSPTEPLASCA